MASLKDQIQTDLTSLFFNLDEFGETHTIGGSEVTVIVDSERLKERNAKDMQGLETGELLVFVRTSDLVGGRPHLGSPLIFDGRPMIVADVKDDLGVYEIILTQNRGG